MADIIKLPANTQGNDYIIGDVHGDYDTFVYALSLLPPHSRLFIAGDLVDRGPNSAALLDLIMSFNAQNETIKIHLIRGNHESLFINYAQTKVFPENYSDEEEKSIAENYFQEKNGGNWASTLSLADYKRYMAYMDTLPYIIHVEGDKPFNVVHADLNYSDTNLLYKIIHNPYLTEAQKHYAIWSRDKSKARENDILISDASERDEFSSPTYCGHSILGGIRPGTNHINLDIGTYDSKIICLLNHTQQTCKLVTKLPLAEIHPDYIDMVKEINEHLANRGVRMDSDDDSDFGPEDNADEEKFYFAACATIIELMNEFQTRYQDYCNANNLSPDDNASYVTLFADLEDIINRLQHIGDARISGSIALEEIVDVIENQFFKLAAGTIFYNERINPFVTVDKIKREHDISSYIRMLAVITAKLHEKYYQDNKGVLIYDFDRERWAPALKELISVYDFKIQLLDIPQQIHPNRMQF